jgi:SPP1 family predicted phage head-tail adaptor
VNGKINPGEFDCRITFQKRVDSENASGETVQVLVNYITVWASIEPLIIKAKEYYEAAQSIRPEMLYQIITWYSPSFSIDATMLIKFGDRAFQIIGVANIGERNRFLNIRAVEKVQV